MTLDLRKAKVGDKVKHRNGGVSVVTDVDDDDASMPIRIGGLLASKVGMLRAWKNLCSQALDAAHEAIKGRAA